MLVQIPPLDPLVAWSVLSRLGYLLFVMAYMYSNALIKQKVADSTVKIVWLDCIGEQSGSLVDDHNVEAEEQLVGGEAAVDEGEGGEEARTHHTASSPLFASDDDTVGPSCALEPIGLHVDASLSSSGPASMPIESPSASSPFAYGNNRFAPLADHDESLQEDASVEDTSAEVASAEDTAVEDTAVEEARSLVSTTGAEEGGDEKKKKKKKKKGGGKGKSKGKSKSNGRGKSKSKGPASPSRHWGFAS